MQVEVARRGIGPVDYKIEPRDFANIREIGVGSLAKIVTERPVKVNSPSVNCGCSRKNSAIARVERVCLR